MNRFRLAAALAACAVFCGTVGQAQALQQAKPPLIRDSGGLGSGPGPGDPSLGGSRMPPGGDEAGVAAAERAEKLAERRRQEAERRKEEARKRREAEAARSRGLSQTRTKNAVSAALASRSSTTAVIAAPPIAASASSTTATRRPVFGAAKAAPSSLPR